METATDWDTLRERLDLDMPVTLPCGATAMPAPYDVHTVTWAFGPDGQFVSQHLVGPRCWLMLTPDTPMAQAVAKAAHLGAVVVAVWQGVPRPDLPPAVFR